MVLSIERSIENKKHEIQFSEIDAQGEQNLNEFPEGFKVRYNCNWRGRADSNRRPRV